MYNINIWHFGDLELELEFGLRCNSYGMVHGVSMQSDCSDTGQTASHPWLCSHVAQSRPGPCLIVSPFVSTCHRPVFSQSPVCG